ncbi:MAG: hypothetical protein D6820_03285, partial [Lentisphaerae bacterium]
MKKAKFIWTDQNTRSRMRHACMRRRFNIGEIPRQAEFACFANSYYHLWINGHHVGFGPARSYPEFPEYDRYLLTPYLRAGENELTVLVRHVGFPTFHSQTMGAFFIGWGRVGEFNLATGEGWEVAECNAYDSETPWFSFAQPPTDWYDAAKDPMINPTLPWHPAVSVEAPENLGTFRPRSIPPLTWEKQPSRDLLWCEKVNDGWQFEGVRLRAPQDVPQHKRQQASATCLVYSFVHSPREQEVAVVGHWG